MYRHITNILYCYQSVAMHWNDCIRTNLCLKVKRHASCKWQTADTESDSASENRLNSIVTTARPKYDHHQLQVVVSGWHNKIVNVKPVKLMLWLKANDYCTAEKKRIEFAFAMPTQRMSMAMLSMCLYVRFLILYDHTFSLAFHCVVIRGIMNEYCV